MEKLLLAVWEAADVLSVSRSRVYELLYAEQLDSVKIGRSRRVALVSRGSCGRSVGVTSSCGLRVKGHRRVPPATCGPTNRPTRPASP
jgi:excisionase family DNA binding protein